MFPKAKPICMAGNDNPVNFAAVDQPIHDLLLNALLCSLVQRPLAGAERLAFGECDLKTAVAPPPEAGAAVTRAIAAELVASGASSPSQPLMESDSAQ